MNVIVTGPTSGIGSEIALRLAAAGASVVLACRDLAKGQRMADEIVRRGAPPATVMQIDASSQASIVRFAEQFCERFTRLDVLVNNAGVSYSARETTVDGLELTLATNVLGYHYLTLGLLDLLKASAPARIVNVASLFAGNLDLDDLQFERRPYDGLQAYAQSKACNRLLTWATARRLEGTGVTATAMAPGFVPGTGLSKNLSPELQKVYSGRTGRTFAQGADTAVWLASSDEVRGISGAFFADRRQQPCEFRDTRVEERLWRICDDLRVA
jgi:retinol dehydrogenase 14